MPGRRIGWISSLILSVGLAGCGGRRHPEALPPAPELAKPAVRFDTLLVNHAASLEQVMAILATRFEAGHPGVVLRHRSVGGVDPVRGPTEPPITPDVVALADEALNPQLLPPPRATWYVVFARNAMVLAYTDRSAFATGIGPANWADVLLRPGARVGRADPRDPAGARALLLFRLAAMHHARPGLAAALERASTTAVPPPHRTLYDALAARALDYVITYRSTARVLGFRVVELPDEINLSDPTRNASYARATVGVPTRSGRADSLVRGAAILYGATVPSGARHRALGEQFVSELLSSQARELLAEWGFLPQVGTIVRGTPPPAIRPE